jgi:putative intracellular protease/amidase
MRNKAYVLVFDGLADWEPALFMCELADQGKLETVTVGFDESPVRSMGGLRILPDATLAEVSVDEAAVFVVPGGGRWYSGTSYELIGLLRALHGAGVPVGGICGATLELARSGLLDGVAHTGNSLDEIRKHVPSYRGEARYVDRLAAGEGGIVTAGGDGYVEFAAELFRQMKLMSDDEIATWVSFVKPGAAAAAG